MFLIVNVSTILQLIVAYKFGAKTISYSEEAAEVLRKESLNPVETSEGALGDWQIKHLSKSCGIFS